MVTGHQEWNGFDSAPTVRDFIELYAMLGEPPERAYERAHQDITDLHANRYPLALPRPHRGFAPVARLAPLLWLGVASYTALPLLATLVVAVPLADLCWRGPRRE